MTQDDAGLQRAHQHVKRVRDFLYHLMVFVFLNGLMVILDRRAGTGGNAIVGLDWAYWLMLFWGLGLAGHAIWAFYGDRRAQQLYLRELQKIERN